MPAPSKAWSHPGSTATLPLMASESATSPRGIAPFPRGWRGFLRGALAVIRGAGRLLSDPELRKLALLPVFVTGVLYVVFVTLAAVYHDDVLAMIWGRPENWLAYLWYVASVVVFVGLIVLLALVFLPIASVISGPFYEKIALSVLARRSINGREGGIIEGIGSALARLAVFAVPALFFAALSIIPYAGLPFIPLATTFGWLGLAAETSEPTLVAANHPLSARLKLVFASFFPMMGAGMMVGLSLLVPLLPLLSLPAAIVGFAELYQPPRPGQEQSAA